MAVTLAASRLPQCNNQSPFLQGRGRPLPVYTLSVRWRRVQKSHVLHVGARCMNTPGRGPGENDSKAVLDAFFLGKAFVEALNERIGTAVGEFLSDVGRWQAEQQKQTRDFQEEVLERARIEREKAAREALGNEQMGQSTSSSYINSTSASSDSSTASHNSGSPADPSSVLNNSGALPTGSSEN